VEPFGKELRERYEVLGELGRGSFAVVYRCHQRSLGRDVAVKYLLAAGGANPEYRARFVKEARMLSELVHPNVEQVLDFGIDGEVPYLVQEFLEGKTLEDIIERSSALKLRRALDIFADVADALAYVHERGVIHRDLKPANVFVTNTGDVKILDFGMAKDTSQETAFTRTGAVLGTPLYMAPEQVLGSSSSAAVDLYALGTMLFEALAGRMPHDVKAKDFLAAKATMDAMKLEAAVGSGRLPRDLVAVVDGLLETDPAKRPRNGGVVKRALVRIRSRLRQDESLPLENVATAATAAKHPKTGPSGAAGDGGTSGAGVDDLSATEAGPARVRAMSSGGARKRRTDSSLSGTIAESVVDMARRGAESVNRFQSRPAVRVTFGILAVTLMVVFAHVLWTGHRTEGGTTAGVVEVRCGAVEPTCTSVVIDVVTDVPAAVRAVACSTTATGTAVAEATVQVREGAQRMVLNGLPAGQDYDIALQARTPSGAGPRRHVKATTRPVATQVVLRNVGHSVAGRGTGAGDGVGAGVGRHQGTLAPSCEAAWLRNGIYAVGTRSEAVVVLDLQVPRVQHEVAVRTRLRFLRPFRDDVIGLADDGTIVRVNVRNGSVVWRRCVGPAVEVKTFVVGPNEVVVRVSGRGLVCFEGSSGDERWTNGDGMISDAFFVTSNGELLLSSALRELRVYDVRRNERMRDPALVRAGDVTAPIFEDGGELFVTMHSSELFMGSLYQRARQRVLLDENISQWTHDDQYLYVVRNGDNSCAALDRHTGTLQWRSPLASQVSTRPNLVDGRLYVMDNEGTVYCHVAETGLLLWQVRPSGVEPIGGVMPVAGGRCYVCTVNDVVLVDGI